MPAVPQIRSAQDLLNWYSDQDEAAWELYRFQAVPKNRQALYHGRDKSDAAEKLNSELSRIHSEDFENYVLVLGNVKGAKDKTFEPLYSRVFVVNERPANMPVMGYVNSGQNQINTEILNEIRALRAERMAEIDTDDNLDDDDEEEEATPSSILAGILQQPRVQEMLIGILGNLASGFMAPKVQQVSGTHDIEQIINTLFSKGVTPDDLSKLAAMPETQIKFLLSMLRK